MFKAVSINFILQLFATLFDVTCNFLWQLLSIFAQNVKGVLSKISFETTVFQFNSGIIFELCNNELCDVLASSQCYL